MDGRCSFLLGPVTDILRGGRRNVRSDGARAHDKLSAIRATTCLLGGAGQRHDARRAPQRLLAAVQDADTCTMRCGKKFRSGQKRRVDAGREDGNKRTRPEDGRSIDASYVMQLREQCDLHYGANHQSETARSFGPFFLRRRSSKQVS